MTEIAQPITRYSGSKRKLVSSIWNALHDVNIHFESVLDIFGGTGSFAYYAKSQGKKVFYNDVFKFNSLIGTALIENDVNLLAYTEALSLLSPQVNVVYDNVIQKNFHDIYFTEDENKQIDIVVQNIEQLDSDSKKASAYYLLFQSCIIKRPYNLFHRSNLSLRTNFSTGRFGNKVTWEKSFEELFDQFYIELESLCFDNGHSNKSLNTSALECNEYADLLYIDPPYFTDKSHVTYHSKYHFLEGLAHYNEIEQNINMKKKNREILINKKDEFEIKDNFMNDLTSLLSRHEKSIYALSYRNNGIPDILEIVKLIQKFKAKVYIVNLGKYNYALNKNNNTNSEWLVIGY